VLYKIKTENATDGVSSDEFNVRVTDDPNERLVTALGHPSGGFKAEAKDLLELDHPAIAPIEYAGFKHFVVIRAVYENRVYLADPALGNISFTLSRFLEVWDNNVLFIVFPNGHKPASGLELREEDMRYVSDFIIAENAYKEFPLMAMKYEDAISNKIASLSNNAKSSFVAKLLPKVNENDPDVAMRDEDGNVLYKIKTENATDGVSSDEFNVRVTDDPNERLVKELRFRRK
jgi:hypothetical protein